MLYNCNYRLLSILVSSYTLCYIHTCISTKFMYTKMYTVELSYNKCYYNSKGNIIRFHVRFCQFISLKSWNLILTVSHCPEFKTQSIIRMSISQLYSDMNKNLLGKCKLNKALSIFFRNAALLPMSKHIINYIAIFITNDWFSYIPSYSSVLTTNSKTN